MNKLHHFQKVQLCVFIRIQHPLLWYCFSQNIRLKRVLLLHFYDHDHIVHAHCYRMCRLYFVKIISYPVSLTIAVWFGPSETFNAYYGRFICWGLFFSQTNSLPDWRLKFLKIFFVKIIIKNYINSTFYISF